MDNIGTRAACPIHLVHAPHEDYAHVQSGMYLAQNKVAPGRGGFREYKKIGSTSRRPRRPLDHFFDQVEFATTINAPRKSSGKKKKKKKGKSPSASAAADADAAASMKAPTVALKVAKKLRKRRQEI